MTAVADKVVEPLRPSPVSGGRRRVPSRFTNPVHRLRRRRQARGPVKPRSVGSMMTAWALTMLSFVAVWVAFYALVLSGLQEAHAQNGAYANFREQLSQQVAPLGGVIKPDAPVALLTAPTMGLHATVVIEGTAAGDLEKGPGHRRDTVLPGQPGIAVIYGRATLFGGPFATITHAHKGDRIVATTGQGRFTYVVRGVRQVGDPYPQPLAAGAGGLTLVTAEGASASNLWRPARPVYVDAVLQGKAQPAPGGRLVTVPQSEKAMSGNVGSLFPLVLWIPLLVLAALAVVWAVDGWGRWQAWLIGAPIVLAALWGATETAVQLLPNLM